MPEVNDLATRRETFSAVAAFARHEVVFDANDGTDARPNDGPCRHAELLRDAWAPAGVRPRATRRATDDTPGAELTLVIAHLLWEQLGADSAVVGRVVRLNGIPVRIAGVAPPKFRGAFLDSGDPYWVPLAASGADEKHASRSRAPIRRCSVMYVSRRAWRSGRRIVRVVAATWVPDQLPTGAPVEHASDVVLLRGVTDLETGPPMAALAAIRRSFPVGMVGTAAMLVLLVACTNVSALMVGAAVRRRRGRSQSACRSVRRGVASSGSSLQARSSHSRAASWV